MKERDLKRQRISENLDQVFMVILLIASYAYVCECWGDVRKIYSHFAERT